VIDLVLENWALVAASVIITALVLQALFVLGSRTPRAMLRRAWGELQAKRHDAAKALRRANRARRQCERLEGRSQSVRPIKLEESRAALSDNEALLNIARDRVLVAENHVRRVIVEHFPPTKHDKLRARYRLGDVPGEKPFTF
jgi:hypothetical protein